MPATRHAALDDRGLRVDRDAERLEHVGRAALATTARGCRAWRRTPPHAAIRIAASVETLIVPAPSPPVPQVSIAALGLAGSASGSRARAHRGRGADELVDRLALRAQRDEQAADLRRRRLAVHDLADHRGHLVARRDRCGRARARSRARWRPSRRRHPQEVREQLLARGRQDRLGVELHALDGAASLWRTPMISSSRSSR